MVPAGRLHSPTPRCLSQLHYSVSEERTRHLLLAQCMYSQYMYNRYTQVPEYAVQRQKPQHQTGLSSRRAGPLRRRHHLHRHSNSRQPSPNRAINSSPLQNMNPD